MNINIKIEWRGRFVYEVTSPDMKAEQESSDDLSSTIKTIRRLICRARSLLRPTTKEAQQPIVESAS